MNASTYQILFHNTIETIKTPMVDPSSLGILFLALALLLTTVTIILTKDDDD